MNESKAKPLHISFIAAHYNLILNRNRFHISFLMQEKFKRAGKTLTITSSYESTLN